MHVSRGRVTIKQMSCECRRVFVQYIFSPLPCTFLHFLNFPFPYARLHFVELLPRQLVLPPSRLELRATPCLAARCFLLALAPLECPFHIYIITCIAPCLSCSLLCAHYCLSFYLNPFMSGLSTLALFSLVNSRHDHGHLQCKTTKATSYVPFSIPCRSLFLALTVQAPTFSVTSPLQLRVFPMLPLLS
jgi:hypothetical protein